MTSWLQSAVAWTHPLWQVVEDVILSVFRWEKVRGRELIFVIVTIRLVHIMLKR